MAGQKPESIFDIEQLFHDVNRSFISAAEQLDQAFLREPWRDSPVVYHMPKMHLSIQLVLSFSDGKVKGFFTKTSTKEEQQLSSAIDVDIVAVPRTNMLHAGSNT